MTNSGTYTCTYEHSYNGTSHLYSYVELIITVHVTRRVMLHGGEVVYREQWPVGHVRRADWSHTHASAESAGCRGVCALFVGAAAGRDGALLSRRAGRTRMPLEALERLALAPEVHYEVGLAHNKRVPLRLMP